mmetsp:Transcript_29525/g.92107  ORF Transcript_29525/g.92107 Transcript_29525/m.92107 type:complete len:237 (-) Transcript_29525:16-726(-)
MQLPPQPQRAARSRRRGLGLSIAIFAAVSLVAETGFVAAWSAGAHGPRTCWKLRGSTLALRAAEEEAPVGSGSRPMKQFVRDKPVVTEDPEGGPRGVGPGVIGLGVLTGLAILSSGGNENELDGPPTERLWQRFARGEDVSGIGTTMLGVVFVVLLLVAGIVVATSSDDSEEKSIWDRPFLDANESGGPLEPLKQFVRGNPLWAGSALAITFIIIGSLWIAVLFRLVRLVLGLPIE